VRYVCVFVLGAVLALTCCTEDNLGRDPVQFAGKVAEGSFSWSHAVPATRPR
jgi:hypothetical protein